MIRTHVKRGKGMQSAKKLKRLNKNLQAILTAVSETEEPLTVGEIRKTLYDNGVKRTRGSWNTSLVQADISRLLSVGLVTMVKEKRRKKRYYMDDRQKKRFVEILLRDGRLRFSIDY